jgi:hypothetical protein
LIRVAEGYRRERERERERERRFNGERAIVASGRKIMSIIAGKAPNHGGPDGAPLFGRGKHGGPGDGPHLCETGR